MDIFLEEHGLLASQRKCAALWYTAGHALFHLLVHTFSSYELRITNGVVTLGAGLIGCLLGGFAYQHTTSQK
jgi:hypothetical protein